ncbi:MAG: GatB/YqeY domain-containing protein [Flavobacteriales bacterium]|nr:GatB/YqeY domain-containing protein [Flavobacteriales bacterium]
MSIVDQINADIKSAMLAKERDKLDALRAVKSALLLEATKGSDSEVSDEVATKVMMKLQKQRLDAAAIYKEQGRDDLLEDEMKQAEVIASYLPEPMSEDEVEAEVRKIIAEVGATSMADMGKVMGKATAALSGKADGKVISGIVRKILN